MADVFISYSRADEAQVGGLVQLLEDHGLTVWWDRNLIGGTKFHRDIENEINAATKVIVLWSKTSVESVWVYDEASAARDQGKLVPVAIDDCVPPMGFRSIHTLRSARLDTITNDLLIACGLTPARQSRTAARDRRDAARTTATNVAPETRRTIGQQPNTNTPEENMKLFDEMFGDLLGTKPAGEQGTDKERGGDLRYELGISLEDAFAGTTKRIQVESDVHCGRCNGSGVEPGSDAHACPACIGTGRVAKERTLSVSIPAGVEDGTHIRLAGEGEAGLHGRQAGDLFVALSIEPHPFFQRNGADVICRVPVSFTTAALGGEIEIPTIDGGTVRVKIPETTKSGQQFRLKGKGMPIQRSKEVGDLYVQIEIETPQSLHHNARVFIENLKSQRTPPPQQNVAIEERGLDLACEIQISFIEAALGGEVTFKPGAEPALLLRFPEGTQDGQTFRLRGKGKEGGDLYVSIKTVALTELTDTERDLLGRLEALEPLGQGPVYPERQSFLERMKH